MLKEHEYLINNYSKESTEDLAKKLGYTVGSVRTIACRLGVNKYYNTPDLPGELWATIDEFPEYWISNKGRIKSTVRNKIMSQRVHEGYYDCRIKDKDGRKRSPRIHRLVARAFVDNPDNKPIVNHKDGNKLNNSSDNLEWVTYQENTLHAMKLGLAGYNTDKLKENEVKDICRHLQSGLSIREITSKNPRYTRSRVEKIRQRKTWLAISKEYNW